jgi:hypothetical protein
VNETVQRIALILGYPVDSEFNVEKPGYPSGPWVVRIARGPVFCRVTVATPNQEPGLAELARSLRTALETEPWLKS